MATDLARFTVLGPVDFSSFNLFCKSLCDVLRCLTPVPLSVTKIVRLVLVVNYVAYLPSPPPSWTCYYVSNVSGFSG